VVRVRTGTGTVDRCYDDVIEGGGKCHDVESERRTGRTSGDKEEQMNNRSAMSSTPLWRIHL
jgi:hypothetical protein